MRSGYVQQENNLESFKFSLVSLQFVLQEYPSQKQSRSNGCRLRCESEMEGWPPREPCPCMHHHIVNGYTVYPLDE